jgi:hypothetical protein
MQAGDNLLLLGRDKKWVNILELWDKSQDHDTLDAQALNDKTLDILEGLYPARESLLNALAAYIAHGHPENSQLRRCLPALKSCCALYVSTGQSTTSGIGFAMGNLVNKSTTIYMMLGWSEIQALERA